MEISFVKTVLSQICPHHKQKKFSQLSLCRYFLIIGNIYPGIKVRVRPDKDSHR